MGEEWKNDRGAPNRFMYDAHKGDIVIIRHQGKPRYLVEIIGECTKNEGENRIDVWFAIYRKVKIINNEGAQYKSKYFLDKGRSWADRCRYGHICWGCRLQSGHESPGNNSGG